MSWAPSRTGVMHLARDGRAACAWTTRLLTPRPASAYTQSPYGDPYRWCKHCAAYAPPPTQLRAVP
jgi:hypothetical protein